ncbi:hypothetical protein KZP23_02760 [Echinicola marina]|uniref:hypothetical protein n=1 Tax=Echinicola marina TaxID=2859768 RepID=UPI001CF66C68|nr:hypothetical protein [Echinicola marina]UCS93974.1 hypothetical protein KZP23_02760 [Echinicola marina]
MKKITPTFPFPVIRYLGMVMAIFMLANCGTKDLEFMEPYEFVNDDFDEVEDLDPVEDPDPEIEEPETGQVNNSDQTEEILTNILNAEKEEDIQPETQEALTTINTVSSTAPASVKEKAAAIDEATVDKILDVETELDEDLEEVSGQLDQLSDEIKALLPVIDFSVDTESNPDDRILQGLKQVDMDLEASMRTMAVVGPCAEAAESAYNELMSSLTAQREDNLETIEANYQRRLAEADTRYNSRLTAQVDKYQENLAQIRSVTTSLIQAAVQLDLLGLSSLAEETRFLALYYALYARFELERWNNQALNLLASRRDVEKATALDIKESREAEVNNAFTDRAESASGIYEGAVNNCHNQGSGN